MSGTETNPIACCWFASLLLASGGETGIVLFFEVAQQLLFAQQFGLQPSGLGAFDRMQEAAGSWRGRIAIANTTAIRIGAALRIALLVAHELGCVDIATRARATSFSLQE